MTVMRAKMQVHGVQEFKDANGNVTQENLILYPVAKDGGYPSDGSDEDNSFARWTPSGELKLTIQRDRVRAHRRRAGRSARAAGGMSELVIDSCAAGGGAR